MLPEVSQGGYREGSWLSFFSWKCRVFRGGLEVAHAGGEKIAGGHVSAQAGGRPLDDELGGHW